MGDDTGSGGGRWTVFQIFVAILLVTTGSINTLAAKWADMLEVRGKPFDHPFVQAVGMFLGEFLCLPAFAVIFLVQKLRQKRKTTMERDLGPLGPIGPADLIQSESKVAPRGITNFNPLIFLPAAMCDMFGTSLMYVGLNLTNAASFQMLRGDLLIIIAQIVSAVQMVYEQKFVLKYDVPPLLAVGFEGLFGMVILSILCVPMYFIHVPGTFTKDPEHRMENALNAFEEMGENHLIIVALLGTILSIAFFNFAGISVTKELSATTRMVLDSVRVLVIWAASLALQWQSFVWLQIIGFVLLIWGMCVYNDILFGPWFRGWFLPWLNKRGISLTPIQKCCFPDLEETRDDISDLIRPSDESPIENPYI